MTALPLRLQVLPGTYAVCRLEPKALVPDWALHGSFCSVTRTAEELSILVEQTDPPDSVESEGGWAGIKVAGPLDFSLTGVLARLATPLAAAGIPIFVISTYDTDYLFVRQLHLGQALVALRASGCEVQG